MPSASARRSPSIRRSTTRPARAHLLEQRVEVVQRRLRRQLGARRVLAQDRRASGASPPARSGRSARSPRSASRARSGSWSRMRRAPCACTTITTSPWATTSCSSRAIRWRSSIAGGAGAARRARARAPRRAACARAARAAGQPRRQPDEPGGEDVARQVDCASDTTTVVHRPSDAEPPARRGRRARPALGAERVERDRARDERRRPAAARRRTGPRRARPCSAAAAA